MSRIDNGDREYMTPKIVYKKVKLSMPHCTNCGEMLDGNGSIATPYQCKCGEWEYNLSDYKWEIKK